MDIQYHHFLCTSTKRACQRQFFQAKDKKKELQWKIDKKCVLLRQLYYSKVLRGHQFMLTVKSRLEARGTIQEIKSLGVLQTET